MNYAIIAAGEGSRLVQEGLHTPKPLVKLNGVPMIKRLIDIFMECNAESISIIINSEMVEVKEYLQTLKLDIPFNLVVKSTPSSMHSFYELSKVMGMDGKFCLTTVDTIFKSEEFKRYISAFECDNISDGMMAITSYIEDEKPLYVEVDIDMDIVGFRDESWEDAKYISGGIYALNASAISVLHECVNRGVARMRNFQRELIASGLKLKGFPMGKIIDVDHITDIPVAEEFIK
ncbi:MAG: NTP transferase domain-containing protein [Bacteroidales bacterium]